MAAKTQFRLNPNPTFNASVPIPVPGDDVQDLVFAFKHMNRVKFAEFLKSLDQAGENKVDQDTTKEPAEIGLDSDVKFILEMASGWELKDEFNAENIRTLLSNYFGASKAIIQTFIDALTVAKAKN